MNISMRDKKLLLMFSGVAVFGLGWFFGYRPQMEEAANIEAANKPLEERLSNLLELAGNRDFYISETESAQNKINEYVAKFPSDVKEENGIVLAQNIENSLGMQISNVGIATKEFVASIDGSTEEEIAEQNETMSEQANSQTREQIDEIEGTDSKAAEELQLSLIHIVLSEAFRGFLYHESVRHLRLPVEQAVQNSGKYADRGCPPLPHESVLCRFLSSKFLPFSGFLRLYDLKSEDFILFWHSVTKI